jgi:serine/threonine-protein kinase
VALSHGFRLGPYEVVAAIGAGGMGEVYRARDTTLNRDVALKVLPDAFLFDPDRLARFKREAQLLASLSHPNIAAIYGFEKSARSPASEQAAVHALVLELIEGPTLAERIAQGPVPLEDAVPIARQIAEALEAAHEQRIVHRDLKPSNIKLTTHGSVAAGTVKVLDFGLAKALEPATVTSGDATASPTITSPAMTAMGLIMGTAAYMSPEQAKGRPADKRSDVWAFGAVLYEMLSGQRAFKGDDVSDTLAAILRQDIDWAALPPSTPVPVRRLIARCLERDVRRRLRDIGEARIVLEDPAASTAAGQEAPTLTTPRPLWRRVIPVALTAIVAGGLAGTVAWYIKPSTSVAVTRFSFMLPEGQTFSGIARRMLDISPDGTQIVYVANGRLYLQSMSQGNAKPIQGTEGFEAATNPVFSPDGRSIAFHATSDPTIKRIPVTGGAALTICAADNYPFGMSWESGYILFSDGKGIRRVSADGGTPEVLVRLRDDEIAESPQMLPGGQAILFTLAKGTVWNRWDTAEIVVETLATGERKTIIRGGSDARYLKTGHIVYATSGTVFAVLFDAQRREVTGSAAPVVAGVLRAMAGTRAQPATDRGLSGAANFSVSNNGTLIYVPGAISFRSGDLEIAVTDRRRRTASLRLPAGAYVAPRVSPDGARIAFGADDGNEAIIYTYHLSGASGMQRLTFGGNNRYPIWSANNRVVFQSDREGDLAIFWQAPGVGAAERLTTPEQGTSHVPESWSPKGDTFLFSVTKGSDVSLWAYSMRDRKAAPFGEVHSSYPTGAVFSPDGRWVAYMSTARTTPVIHVQQFPAAGTPYQLPLGTLEIATHPLWSPDGKELFYNPGPGRFAWVGVTTRPTLTFGNSESGPRPFQTGPPTARRAFDITPDGRFIGLIQKGAYTESGTLIAPHIQVVLNWFEELPTSSTRGRAAQR